MNNNPIAVNLLPSVGPSEFGPKRTSVLSEPVAHRATVIIEHRKFRSESNTIGRRPCQQNRLDLQRDDLFQIRNPISIFHYPD